MAKKRKAEDPNAPPKPKWTPPKDDPMWQDYMKDCLYDGYEMHRATSAQLLPYKLPWPFKPCPDRSKLSKNAEAALVRAISIFENRLSAVENALPIRELVKAGEDVKVLATKLREQEASYESRLSRLRSQNEQIIQETVILLICFR